MSRAAGEWVRAPTETASTPVAATSAMVSKVMVPEASSWDVDPEVLRRSTISGHLLGGHVVQQDPLDLTVQRFAGFLRGGDFDLDRHTPAFRGHAVPDPANGRQDAAGRSEMVLLEQHHGGQVEPVVRSPAATHGVLVHGPETGRGLAGVEQPDRARPDRSYEGRREGCDARHPLEEVQRHPLAGDDRVRRTTDPRQRSVRETGSPSATAGRTVTVGSTAAYTLVQQADRLRAPAAWRSSSPRLVAPLGHSTVW